MKDLDLLIYELEAWASMDAEDLECSSFECYGEDEHGNEGSWDVNIADMIEAATIQLRRYQATPTATEMLARLGHVETEATRCRAIHRNIPGVDYAGPAPTPVWCSLQVGHDGPHIHSYGTKRFKLNPKLTIIGPPLKNTCACCKTTWPCDSALKVLEGK